MRPLELQALVDQIEQCEAEAARLVADLDEDALNRPPAAHARAGQWSIAQCLEHLTLMNAFYLQGWGDAVAAARQGGAGPFRGLHPTAAGRWFARTMEPPVRFKARTVRQVTPASHVPREKLLDRYRASHDEYRALVEAAADVDVNRVVRPNPILKMVRMRLATVLLIVPAHDRRHLWQAANVRRALTGG